MKPRVFISSTYYDLKHVRERLERFVEGFYFEPILFESDEVTFEHDKPLDTSCYNEVKLCHMMILIIGGRYGSEISGNDVKKKRESYNKEYISITRREFETAKNKRIPTFVFIDKNVYAEYETYKKNIALFKDTATLEKHEFKFAHVDDANIFEFINIVSTSAVKTFERVEEIESYLGNQFSGMFYLYLEGLQKAKNDKEVLDAVSELKQISEGMSTMLNAVGKDVLKDEDTYKNAILDQKKTIIELLTEQLLSAFRWKYVSHEDAEIYAPSILQILKTTILNKDLIRDATYEQILVLTKDFEHKVSKINQNLSIVIEQPYLVFRVFNKIIPAVEDNETLSKYYDELMIENIQEAISDFPF